MTCLLSLFFGMVDSQDLTFAYFLGETQRQLVFVAEAARGAPAGTPGGDVDRLAAHMPTSN